MSDNLMNKVLNQMNNSSELRLDLCASIAEVEYQVKADNPSLHHIQCESRLRNDACINEFLGHNTNRICKL